MPVDLSAGSFTTREIHKDFFPANLGSIPTLYRDVFEMFNSHGLNKLTFTIFVPLFESNTLTKSILNQASLLKLFGGKVERCIFVKVWYAVTKTNSIGSRNDLYKCLALMALAQQGKTIDEKLLDNYTDRGIAFIVWY
jgi:hypothetical protein